MIQRTSKGESRIRRMPRRVATIGAPDAPRVCHE
jgi:hypothetical protein